MTFIKGARLYVELSASQTRRRLRGQGYGVRRVETAGRNRAAIVHTATGQHLRELEGLFRDVLAAVEVSREGEEHADDVDADDN